MSEELTLRLHRIAISIACRIGYREHAEDIAQYVVLCSLEKNQQGYNGFISVRWLILNWLKVHGPHSQREKRVPTVSVPLETLPANSAPEFDFEIFLNSLTKDERVVATLRIEWGLDDHEVGRVLGYHPNSVQRLWARVKLKLLEKPDLKHKRPIFQHGKKTIPSEWEEKLGTMPDTVIAKQFGYSKHSIQRMRKERNIPAYKKV